MASTMTLKYVLGSLFCRRKNKARNPENIYVSDPIKMNAKRVIRMVIIKSVPSDNAVGSSNNAEDNEIIKNKTALRIPAFSTTAMGDSSFSWIKSSV